MTDATHWGVGEVDMTWNDEDSAIEQHLDNHAVPLPEMITVDGYKPMELSASRALSIIEGHADLIFENLAEEFSWEDMNSHWEPTDKIKTAMQALAKAISEDYPVRLMEPVSGSSYEVDVREWVRENRPAWLADKPGLFGRDAA